MKICLTGGTGFIGSRVANFFKEQGFDVENITRSNLKQSINIWKYKIDGAEILINLAGAPIFKKWTPAYKKQILNSRVDTTKKILEAIQQVDNKPSLVLSASAVGIYDAVEVHDEFSDNLSKDFLAEVCKQWEAAIAPIASEETRLAIIRIGVVLDEQGGALAKMLPSFKMGAGAIMGSGEQAFPCIHISDFLSAIWFIYKNTQCNGIFNMVAPDIVSNKHFSKLLGKHLSKPILFKAPEWLLNLALGEMAHTLTQGQKVKPNRLLELNFPFQYATVDSMLHHIVNK